MFGKDEFLMGDVRHKTARYAGEEVRNKSPKCGRIERAREAQWVDGRGTPDSVQQKGLWARVGSREGFAWVLVCKLEENC